MIVPGVTKVKAAQQGFRGAARRGGAWPAVSGGSPGARKRLAVRTALRQI
jgi:hypothetical protein